MTQRRLPSQQGWEAARRGMLVIAVILGHFAEVTDRESFFTWNGAGFRMPLFIGLTGFLFRLERARAMPLPRLLRRYTIG